MLVLHSRLFFLTYLPDELVYLLYLSGVLFKHLADLADIVTELVHCDAASHFLSQFFHSFLDVHPGGWLELIFALKLTARTSTTLISIFVLLVIDKGYFFA